MTWFWQCPITRPLAILYCLVMTHLFFGRIHPAERGESDLSGEVDNGG